MLNKNLAIPNWLILTLIVVSLLGFLDALYLTIEHFRGVAPACSIVAGCETVTSSSYSQILGIPVALLGAVYYSLALFASLHYFNTGSLSLYRFLPGLATLAFLASIYFVVLQVFVIRALCLYCLFSGLTSTLIFVFAWLGLRLSIDITS